MKKHLLTSSCDGGGITRLRNNAFTLIELLAIIVILAIIAVITVPIILNIIENSRKGAATDSAYGYKDSINKYYLGRLSEQSNYNMPNGIYTVNGTTGYLEGTGDLEGTEPLRVEVSGQKPNSGGVELEKNAIKQACLKFGDYAVTISDGKVGQAEKKNCNGTVLEISQESNSNNEQITITCSTLPANTTAHSEQTLTNDVGIDKYGNPVNLDYYVNSCGDDEKLYSLDGDNLSIIGGYCEGLIENGILAVNIPQCIKSDDFGDDDFHSVTEIGGFSDGLLTEFPELPNTITTIANESFRNNDFSELELIIPSNITTIGDGALDHIGKLIIPSTVETIGEGACSVVENGELTIGMKDIPYNAFQGLSLSKLTFLSTVETIGEGAFSEGNIPNVTIPSNIQSIGDNAFENSGIITLNLPEDMTNVDIGQEAFSANNISELVIPSGITSLDYGQFSYNPFTKLTIPSSVTSIHDSICQSCQSVELTIGMQTIPSYIFNNKSISKLTLLPTVEIIEDMAFENNNIDELIIPSSVTSIGGYAFYDNDISELTIPSNVSTIGELAFCNNNSNLTSITVKGKTANTLPNTWDVNWNGSEYDRLGDPEYVYTVIYDNE